jgi:hypothetical protein
VSGGNSERGSKEDLLEGSDVEINIPSPVEGEGVGASPETVSSESSDSRDGERRGNAFIGGGAWGGQGNSGGGATEEVPAAGMSWWAEAMAETDQVEDIDEVVEKMDGGEKEVGKEKGGGEGKERGGEEAGEGMGRKEGRETGEEEEERGEKRGEEKTVKSPSQTELRQGRRGKSSLGTCPFYWG